VGEAEVTYQVIWEDSALAELDRIWIASLDKEGVKNTATRIDIELTFNAAEAGESRYEDYRLLVKYPLVVWFRVIERMKTVQVLHVRELRRT
jgi:plasmid stabilization system protein ParE